MGQRGTLALLVRTELQVLQVRLVQQDLRVPQALQAIPELLAWQVQLVPPGPPGPQVRMELQVLQARLVKQDLRVPQALRGLPVLLVQMELQVPMGPWVKLALRVRLVQQGPRVLQVKQVP